MNFVVDDVVVGDGVCEIVKVKCVCDNDWCECEFFDM